MWDLYLDACLFAYRISVHATTGFSPFESHSFKESSGEDEIKKFRPSWFGPFKVIRVLSPQTIEIQVPLGSNMSTTQKIYEVSNSSKITGIQKTIPDKNRK
ncbi:hypothetical protein RB653_003163 [Dictyostelium firmibasis]|uniref:Uncharacterized protein n=1 Tax=Dictyostelium firmibasis TaxID=79012 RepID=A0AAN7YZB0_9MYCE